MSRDKLKQILLPLLAGILGFASFPKIDLSYPAWISSAVLLIFIFSNRSSWSAFCGGLLAGTIQLGGLMIWIPSVLSHYGGLPAPVAWVSYLFLILMLALFPAASCWTTRFLMNRLGDGFLLAFPFIWVAMEYSLSFVPFGGFPWLLAGYSQTRHLYLIQIADLTGVYGVSFLLIWFNSGIAWIFLSRRRGRALLWPLGLGILLILASLLYGSSAVRRWTAPEADHRVAMIQGNLSSDEDWQTLKWKFQEGYTRIADGLTPGSAELLILPEAPSPVSFELDARYRESMQQLAARFSLGLIFNNVAYEDIAGTSRYFNSAYFLNCKGEVLGRYDKIHLVPFGEYIPLKRIFSFTQTISKDVGDFSPGSEYRNVSIAGGHPVSAIICFEAVFPQLARRLVQAGGSLIVNLTNDAWYGASAAPYQHLLMSRWRALENRRFLLRATNSGISAVIDPLGRIQVETGLLKEEICLGRFAFIEDRSFYSLHGDWFAGLCAIITVGLLLFSLIFPQLDRRTGEN